MDNVKSIVWIISKGLSMSKRLEWNIGTFSYETVFGGCKKWKHFENRQYTSICVVCSFCLIGIAISFQSQLTYYWTKYDFHFAILSSMASIINEDTREISHSLN